MAIHKKDLKFSIGYNGDLDKFLKLVKKYRKNIKSVYFPIPIKYMNSCRILKESETYISDINKLLRNLKKLKIISLMLLNSTIINPRKIKGIIKFIEHLKNNKLLNDIVVTDPFLLKSIRAYFPKLNIEVSVVAHVRTLEEAKYYKDLGANKISIDREIIRDLNQIKKISKILPVKILLNEGCIKNCIYRYSHYNHLSSYNWLSFSKLNTKNRNEINHMCIINVIKYPFKFFSSPFVRPEDLKYYLDKNLDFKLSTRNFTTKKIEKCLIAYSQQNYNGNLLDILNSNYLNFIFDYIDNNELNNYSFFNKLSKCKDNCEKCNYCKNLLIRTAIFNSDIKCLNYDLWGLKNKLIELNKKFNEIYKDKFDSITSTGLFRKLSISLQKKNVNKFLCFLKSKKDSYKLIKRKEKYEITISAKTLLKLFNIIDFLNKKIYIRYFKRKYNKDGNNKIKIAQINLENEITIIFFKELFIENKNFKQIIMKLSKEYGLDKHEKKKILNDLKLFYKSFSNYEYLPKI